MLKNKVRTYLDLNKTDGEVGIEVEVEMSDESNFNFGLGSPWRVDGDNSLKGYGYEFVLNKPCHKKHVKKHMTMLRHVIGNTGNTINQSIRAGVHIHLNMQENSIGDVFKLMACYYPLETALTRFCGNGREGNLFCLRAADAEYMIEMATTAAQVGDVYLLRTDHLRYSAFNIQSLFLYGSVEFRAMGTTPELENIEPWIEILQRLQTHAIKTESCWENIASISGLGPREWMYSIFGTRLGKLLDYPDIERDIMNDTRRVQMLCHTLATKGL